MPDCVWPASSSISEKMWRGHPSVDINWGFLHILNKHRHTNYRAFSLEAVSIRRGVPTMQIVSLLYVGCLEMLHSRQRFGCRPNSQQPRSHVNKVKYNMPCKCVDTFNMKQDERWLQVNDVCIDVFAFQHSSSSDRWLFICCRRFHLIGILQLAHSNPLLSSGFDGFVLNKTTHGDSTLLDPFRTPSRTVLKLCALSVLDLSIDPKWLTEPQGWAIFCGIKAAHKICDVMVLWIPLPRSHRSECCSGREEDTHALLSLLFVYIPLNYMIMMSLCVLACVRMVQ